jgi:RNA processing factor Prp31
VVLDETLAQTVFDAMKGSMGFDVCEIDLVNILSFATRVEELSK